MASRSVRTLALYGTYGDVMWSLGSVVPYIPDTEIPVRLYVANLTDVDREYMLMVSVSSADTVLSEFTFKIDGAAWFTVNANDVVSLPGSIVSDYTDVVLTLQLFERESGIITDSVSTVLIVTPGEEQYLPVLPGLPTIGGIGLDSLIFAMIMIMMIKMMTKTMEEDKEKEK